MTPERLLDLFSLEDLETVEAALLAERAQAATLPPEERARVFADLDILAAELEAQQANQKRRLRS